MSKPDKTKKPLLLPMPDACTDRAVLVMLRRMGAHGLRDAHAAMLAMKHFGLAFRQPLTLLRCYIAEVAQGSRRSIHIASCCAPRMTQDEALMLETLALAQERPERATGNLDRLTAQGSTNRAFTVAAAFATALANAGLPLEG